MLLTTRKKQIGNADTTLSLHCSFTKTDGIRTRRCVKSGGAGNSLRSITGRTPFIVILCVYCWLCPLLQKAIRQALHKLGVINEPAILYSLRSNLL